MNRQETLELLKKNEGNLKEYGVESLALFGSVGRNEAHRESDVDLLVSFHQPPGLFGFLALKNHLEEILHTKVDLVTKEALHRRLKDQILKESISAF